MSKRSDQIRLNLATVAILGQTPRRDHPNKGETLVADVHIEEFYKDLAKILLQLHACFPRKTQVFVEDISGPDQPDEYGLHSARHQSCFAAIIWLAEEDFIRYESTIRQEAIDQAVLTLKSFLRLNSLASLNNREKHTVAFVSSGNHCLAGEKPDHSALIEPITNVQLVRHTVKTASSTQLARVLENILFSCPD